MLRNVLAAALALALAEAATAAERIKVDVTISPSVEGATAHFEIAEEVSEFQLDYRNEIADRTWSLATTDLAYAAGTVRGSKPFRTFDVSVRAENDLSGPFYPCLMKLGQSGRVFYPPYFAGEPTTYETAFHLKAMPGDIVLGAPNGTPSFTADRALYGQHGGGSYIFVGPPTLHRKGKSADYVVGPETPAWIVPELQRLTGKLLPYYQRRTNVSLKRKPLYLVTWEPQEHSFAFQGDGTDGPNVAFRFFGDWSKPDDMRLAEMEHFVPHEAAHIWNGHTFRSQSRPWLHEGGAEYWSFVAQRDLKLKANSDPITLLNECIERLGKDPLDRGHNRIAYVCGATLQWFADLAERRRGRDIFSIWRTMFARAEANGGFYHGGMFRELALQASPSVEEAFALVFDGGREDRWTKLPNILGKLGAQLEAAPYPPEKMRHALMYHLLDEACETGSTGKNNYDDHFTLDTNKTCGPLASGPEVDALNDHNLFTDTAAAYASVKSACEKGGAVTLSRQGKQETQTVTCNTPLWEPPTFRLSSGTW